MDSLFPAEFNLETVRKLQAKRTGQWAILKRHATSITEGVMKAANNGYTYYDIPIDVSLSYELRQFIIRDLAKRFPGCVCYSGAHTKEYKRFSDADDFPPACVWRIVF